MIHGIEHTALSVPDMDRALAFYCDLLGFEVEWRAGWTKGSASMDLLIGVKESATKVAMIRLGDTRIEIFEFASPTPAPQDPERSAHDHGIAHFCLAVSDIGGEYERLRQAGMPFNSPPVPVGGGGACVYGRDPFGNLIEFREANAAV